MDDDVMSGRGGERHDPLGRGMVGTALYLLLGAILWGLHFTIVYGFHSFGCAAGASIAQIHAVLAGATLVCLMLLAIAIVRPSLPRRLFQRRTWPQPQQATFDKVMIGLSLLSAFAIAAGGTTAFFVAACGALR